MSKTADKSDPKLWEKVKTEVTKGDKGGKPGQWSARKAQMASKEYKAEGGGYEGKKDGDNALQTWSDEDWGTKSGKDSEKTGERYLPKGARDGLSKEEYERTTAKKRADTKKGKQFSSQPGDVAKKTAKHRSTGGAKPSSHASPKASSNGSSKAASRTIASRAELYEQAKKKNVAGRSKMSRAELEKAVA